jgi:hypothetical protein
MQYQIDLSVTFFAISAFSCRMAVSSFHLFSNNVYPSLMPVDMHSRKVEEAKHRCG